MDLQILIPLKRLAGAKQRLHPALGGDERRRLMLAMVEHVAREAVAADVGPVALASCEPLAPALARTYRVGLVSDGELPWNEGLDHARGLISPAPQAVLYLAGDLPLVSASDVRALVAAMPERGIAIGRAHDGGTNALAVRPADVITPAFGSAGSALVHAQLAASGRDRVGHARPPRAGARRRHARRRTPRKAVTDSVTTTCNAQVTPASRV